MNIRPDQLKPFSALLEPDSRQRGFERFDTELGRWCAITYEDYYAPIALISLHSGVPSQIQRHFATALNLLAYSWFYYPFNVTAQFLGYVSVEFALRERYQAKISDSFRKLVTRAVADHLVTDEGFSHIIQPVERPTPPFMPPPDPNGDEGSYAETLTEIMPGLRNHLAHGSNMLHMHGIGSVRICAEFINQLFPFAE